jgi:hypothetical protein
VVLGVVGVGLGVGFGAVGVTGVVWGAVGVTGVTVVVWTGVTVVEVWTGVTVVVVCGFGFGVVVVFVATVGVVLAVVAVVVEFVLVPELPQPAAATAAPIIVSSSIRFTARTPCRR